MSLYNYPKYYEIAFSFRNVSSEVDFFEYLINKYSTVNVKEVMELASGTSPYFEEWNKRGYQYSGLDINVNMVNFVKKKAKKKHIKVKLMKMDMVNFVIDNYRADLVYTLLGSLYVKSNDELFKHLDSVDSVLVSGGLYILTEVVTTEMINRKADVWTISSGDVSVKTTYKAKIIDLTSRMQLECLKMEVCDKGKDDVISGEILHRYFKLDELKSLIEKHGKFSLVSEYSNFNHVKVSKKDKRTILVLKKR